MANQARLGENGELIYSEEKEVEELENEPTVNALKSILQKSVRRSDWRRAAWAAYKLSTQKTGWLLWRRLRVIAIEDCLNPGIYTAITEMGREAQREGYDSWDGKRLAVAAAILLADSKKDRRADEFVELMDYVEKGIIQESELEFAGDLRDWEKDGHTTEGIKAGRGFWRPEGVRFWVEESSKCIGVSGSYAVWRRFFDELRLSRLDKIAEAEGQRRKSHSSQQ